MQKQALALTALALLAACTTNRFEADVTRFHMTQPGLRGSIHLEPIDKAAAGTLEFQNYASAVNAELAEHGFSVAPGRDTAEYIGVLAYGQTMREGIGGGSPVTIGIGGGTFGRNVGVGLGTSFGIGEKKSKETAINMLALKIERASDKSIVWEGRAVAEAGSTARYGPLPEAMPALADALLRDFPGTSGQTVTYKSE
ncbi:DUF4136 domain-containing protein [Sphingosinicella soli]|uniref:DUF4136 domain-containing protein n=1 Tax=Sphingosinicella soli TaxID=333708 RepID=A0A7W7F854_9SPHN|nr:DUF4136 domain-containing protein [Sphingosinicella soli]MBB4633322.1 hypothetical protein [Sphingosinicella soli]